MPDNAPVLTHQDGTQVQGANASAKPASAAARQSKLFSEMVLPKTLFE
jgi:hypothetical protein